MARMEMDCNLKMLSVTDGSASGLAPPTAGVHEQWHNRHEFVDARSGLKRTFITVEPEANYNKMKRNETN